MLKSTTLSDCMLTRPVKVKPTDSILHAMKIIIDNRISGLCVVDEQENLVGVLSEMDCMRAALDKAYNEGTPGRVEDYMTREPLIVSTPEDHIVDVARDMLSQNKRRRPVVRDGKLVGQITARQVLRAVQKFHGRG
jgi:CBS domain-containing protein